MPVNVRELRVFMASPGDLETERESLRNLERRINAMFRDRGVRVCISGWEEVQPEVGRPQALINPLVHDCEIFIGLLNVRWGSATGTHTSGFEEEFEIALARRRSQGDKPVIGIFFRAIGAERLADMGPQLTAVLAFQERVRRERLALYKTFRSADELALEIFDFLTPYAMHLADEIVHEGFDTGTVITGSTPTAVKPAGVESSEAAEIRTSDDVLLGTRRRELDSAQRQILEALDELSNMFADGKPLNQAARDRVSLVGTAFAEDLSLLGIHHVNRLYARRANLDLTLGEFRTWCRTYFANAGTTDREGRTVPIWGVVDLLANGGQFLDELSHVVQDDEASVVRGVLRFLTDHSIRLKVLWAEDTGEEDGDGAGSPSFAKPIARWSHLFKQFAPIDVALNHMAALANSEDLPLLASVAASDDVDERSRMLVDALANSLGKETDNLEQLAPPKYSSDDTVSIRRRLIDLMPRLDPGQWDTMLNNTTHDSISAAAAVQLIQRTRVTEKQLKAIVELRDPSLRDALVERASIDADWAVDTIQMFSDIDDVSKANLISRLLAASSAPEILEALDKRERLSVNCWVARTIQDPEAFADAAREVLDGESDFLERRVTPLQEQYAAIAGHITATARAASCDVLGKVVNLEDRDMDRVADELRRDHYVSRRSALQALVHLVTRASNAAERPLPDLGDLSILDSYLSKQEIDNLLDSPLAEKVVPLWRESNVAMLRTAASIWELQQGDATDEALEEALYQDDEGVRMAAVDQLILRWDTEQLENLMTRYGNRDRVYWYNVTAALDDHLYGYSSVARGFDPADLTEAMPS